MFNCSFQKQLLQDQLVFKKSYTGRDHSYIDVFFKEFQREFTAMNSLYKNVNNYSDYFPRYMDCCRDSSQPPFILMEYVAGRPLSDYLTSDQPFNPSPAMRLSNAQLHRICTQVYDMIRILYAHGILYLDLTPENVIITDEHTFSVKLIDFTFCRHTGQKNQFIKTSDYHLNTQWPDSLLLLRSMMLFFTRMFFKNSEDFEQYFSWDSFHRFALQNGYGNLLDQMLPSTDDNLLYEARHTREPSPFYLLNRWCERLFVRLDYLTDHRPF